MQNLSGKRTMKIAYHLANVKRFVKETSRQDSRKYKNTFGNTLESVYHDQKSHPCKVFTFGIVICSHIY